jgi:hypothetical protein
VTFADHNADSKKRNAKITKTKFASARKDYLSEYKSLLLVKVVEIADWHDGDEQKRLLQDWIRTYSPANSQCVKKCIQIWLLFLMKKIHLN